MMPRILALAVLGSLAWSQTGTFTVHGRVLTSSGQPLKKAEVLLATVNNMLKPFGAVLFARRAAWVCDADNVRENSDPSVRHDTGGF